MTMTDLEFIENIQNLPTFTKNDWKKLHKDLGNYIIGVDAKKNVVRPLRDVLNYLRHGTDVTEKFQIASLMYSLSAFTNRNQQIETFQGSILLNLWFLIVGQSGLGRKDTVADRIENILNEFPDINVFSANSTVAGIIDEWSKDPQSANQRWLSSEISMLIKGSKQEHSSILPEIMVKMYDGKTFENRTRSFGFETIEDPYLVFWGATQPIMARDYFTEQMLAQGFLLRFMYCLELEKWDYGDRKSSTKVFNRYFQPAVDFFDSIKNSQIEVFTYKPIVELQNYLDYCKKIELQAQHDIFSPVFSYYSRTPEFVFKVAAILENARQTYGGSVASNVGIQPETMRLAVKIVRMFEQDFRLMIKIMRSSTTAKDVETDSEEINLVLRKIKEQPYNIITLPDLIDATGYNRDRLRVVTNTLEDARKIVRGSAPKTDNKRGAPSVMYWYVGGKEYYSEQEAQVLWLRVRGFDELADELEGKKGE